MTSPPVPARMYLPCLALPALALGHAMPLVPTLRLLAWMSGVRQAVIILPIQTALLPIANVPKYSNSELKYMTDPHFPR